MPSETPDKASRTGADATKPARIKVLQRLIGAGIVITVLAAGAAGGAGAYRYVQKSHPQSVLLLQPSPVAQMTESGAVAVKGQVAEVFGNKFIIQDESGRTLVDTGPRGEGGKLVAKGETVTVQGQFANGFIHANVMTRADGTSEAFGPPKHPHPDHGPGSDRGPVREPPPQHPEG